GRASLDRRVPCRRRSLRPNTRLWRCCSRRPREDFRSRILGEGRSKRGQQQPGTMETDTRRLVCSSRTLCALDATPKVNTRAPSCFPYAAFLECGPEELQPPFGKHIKEDAI